MTIELTIRGRIADIELCRPDRGNAIDLATAHAFARVMRELDVARESVDVVVVTGRGARFCVGGDVTEMTDSSDPGKHVAELAAAMHAGLAILHTFDRPIVCAVQGAAAGAGLALALQADFLLAEPGTRLVAAYGGIGLTPDCGMSWLLAQALGLHSATRLMMSADGVTAESARDLGLVHDVVDVGSAAAAQLATHLADGAPLALGRTRWLLRGARVAEFQEQLDREAAEIARAAGRSEFARLTSRFSTRAGKST